MNAQKYEEQVLIYNQSLSIKQRSDIIEDLEKRYEELPVPQGFRKDYLRGFDDKSLVIHLLDVYEILAIKFFKENNKKLGQWVVLH